MNSNNSKKRDIVIISVLVLGLLYSIFLSEKRYTAFDILQRDSKQKEVVSKQRIKELESNAVADEQEKEKFKANAAAKELEIIKLKTSLFALEKVVASNVEKIKKFNRTDISSYYIERYKLPLQIRTTETGTELSDTVARMNVTELVKYDGVKVELKITNDVLVKTEGRANDLKTALSFSENETQQYKDVSREKDTIIKIKEVLVNASKKETKKEKNKKNFWKVVAGFLTTALAYLIFKPF